MGSMSTKTGIPNAVRKAVYERDSWDGAPCCVYCGKPYPEVHHYIERSRGGMGIEQNLVCLCHRCHQRLHSGHNEIKTFVRTYLSEKYEGWEEERLIVQKED